MEQSTMIKIWIKLKIVFNINEQTTWYNFKSDLFDSIFVFYYRVLQQLIN